ncbi:MAG TPA: hypothetical protein VFM71_06750 [Gemmatimonadaceae bacterium]|nr:hypothetical protein [Gemmatimonadaceae bacterium]
MRNQEPADRRRAVREERVTSTGWRISGREALQLVERAAESLAVQPDRDDDVLYAARFSLRPMFGAGSAVHAVLGALGAAIARDWDAAPPLTRDRPVERRATRFDGLSWDVLGETGSWTGELRWRQKHPVIAGAACTTHAIIVEQGLQTHLFVRVTADAGLASVRGLVGAGQARPGFLADVVRACRVSFDGSDATPVTLEEHEIEDFVRDVLLSESRLHPVAILAPLEAGGFVLPPAELAAELMGLAHVHCIQRHQDTFRLTDALGDRRLSAYWGALHVYMPDFSCADDGSRHPLLVHDRLIDPVLRAALVGRLGVFAAKRVRMPAGVAERRNPASAEPVGVVSTDSTASAASTDAPAAAHGNGASRTASHVPSGVPMLVIPPELTRLGAQLEEFTARIGAMIEAQRTLIEEVERLRTTSAVRAANTTSLERRIGALERLLHAHFDPSVNAEADGALDERAAADELTERGDEEDADERLSLLDVLRQAAAMYPDELLILDNAERSAQASPYEDPDRVAVILDAMAQVARRRQAGALGTSLRDAFRDLGVEYRGGIAASTSKRLREQYLVRGPRGAEYECNEHIVLGASYDPRHCLRIYFTSRAAVEPRLVIGHVGRHFTVMTST